MFVALDKETDRLIDADEAACRAEKACYACPCCGGDLILRAGEVKAAHFAHRVGSDCDDFTHDMSDWHKWWQSQFPVQCREVPFESNGERHRADVAAGDFVIEFQHSPISPDEFWRRNRFYNSCGRLVYWVFDVSEPYEAGNLECYDETRDGGKFSWKWPWKTFHSIVPQKHRDRVVLMIDTVGFEKGEYTDGGDILVRGDVAYPLERIVWCIDRNGGGDYSRFITEYYPSTAAELKEFVKEECVKRRRHKARGSS